MQRQHMLYKTHDADVAIGIVGFCLLGFALFFIAFSLWTSNQPQYQKRDKESNLTCYITKEDKFVECK